MRFSVYLWQSIPSFLYQVRISCLRAHFRTGISTRWGSAHIQRVDTREGSIWHWLLRYHFRSPDVSFASLITFCLMTFLCLYCAPADSSNSIIAQCFPLRKRPLFTGLAAAFEGVSSAVAPMLGGALTQSISWRWCFYINLPLGGLSFLLILLFFRDPLKSKRKTLPWRAKLRQLDLLGAGLFITSVTLPLLALQWGGTTYSWGDGRIIVLFVLSGVILTAFVWHQKRKGDHALLPARVMRSRSVFAGVWFGLCNNSSLSVFEYYVCAPGR